MILVECIRGGLNDVGIGHVGISAMKRKCRVASRVRKGSMRASRVVHTGYGVHVQGPVAPTIARVNSNVYKFYS